MLQRSLSRIMVATIGMVVAGCHVYSGEEIQGRVIDDRSNQPVEKAVVTVVWDLYGGAVHGSTVGRLLIQEAVTDSRGHFSVPAWGPKLVLWNSLRNGAPTVLITHNDYYVAMVGHADSTGGRSPSSLTVENRDCSCNGQTFALARFDGDWNRYRQNAETALASLPIGLASGGFACSWKDAPGFAARMVIRAQRLNERKIIHAIPTLEQLGSQPACGGVETLLEEQNNENNPHEGARVDVRRRVGAVVARL